MKSYNIFAFIVGSSVEIGSPVIYLSDQSQILDLDLRLFLKIEKIKFGVQVEQTQWDREVTYKRKDENINFNNDEPTGLENKTFLAGGYFTFDFLEFESFLFYVGGNAGQAVRRFSYVNTRNNERSVESIGEYYGAQAGISVHLNESIDLSLEYLYHYLSEDVDEFLDEESGNYEFEMDNSLDLHMGRLLLTVFF